jgi:hypothetical protein
LACVPTTSVFARAHEVPHRFVRLIGDVNRAQFASAMQAREHLTVAAIGFHPIPAALRDYRWTHDHAVFAAARQMPMNAEPARARFVYEVQATVGRAERAHHLVERLEIARDDSVVADFSITLPFRNRDVDRFLVDIQPPRTCYGSP